MASLDMNRLMDNARIRLPGALDTAIQYELFSVMNEFFQNSNCWKEDITVPVVSTITSYDITPTMGVINRLLYLVDSNGYPQGAGMSTPGTIDLLVAPAIADTWTATVGLTVTDPITRDGYPEFPAWILNKYGNDLLDGVLGRMMSQLAKPYSNQQLAIYHLKRFQGAISQAKVEAQHANVYRAQAWSFPSSFNRSRRR